MKKILLASALLVPLVIVALTFVQQLLVPLALVGLKMMQGPTTYTIFGSLRTMNGTVVGLDFGPVIGGTVTSSPGSIGGFGDGIHCPPACTTAYAPGTLVTLWATPRAGWVFTGWDLQPGYPGVVESGCQGTAPCRIWMGSTGSTWSATFQRR